MDILCITPFDTVSLKLLKTKGYFTDLCSSAILSKQVSRLYPGLQKGLTTDDGKLSAGMRRLKPICLTRQWMCWSRTA